MWATLIPIALAAAIMACLVSLASRINDVRQVREIHYAALAQDIDGSTSERTRRSPHSSAITITEALAGSHHGGGLASVMGGERP